MLQNVQNGVYTYDLKYVLDASGNSMLSNILDTTSTVDDFMVTVTGDDLGDGTIAATSIVEFDAATDSSLGPTTSPSGPTASPSQLPTCSPAGCDPTSSPTSVPSSTATKLTRSLPLVYGVPLFFALLVHSFWM